MAEANLIATLLGLPPQDIVVVVQPNAACLAEVYDVQAAREHLKEPDGRGVTHAKVPGRHNWLLNVDRHILDAALGLSRSHFTAPIRALDGRLERALKLLLVLLRRH